MQLRNPKKCRRGFTLIELAVVMGVIGVVTAGLWRLSNISNLQNKDQATAQQQLALISAVKAYLVDATATTGGQAFLNSLGAGNKGNLPLPSSCPTSGGASYDTTFCNYLPSGFTAGTTNPYGQTYTIQVKAGTTTANQGYSFMIMTSIPTGGSPIPDADGGRIAGLIGGDGGFIYTNNVCTTSSPQNTACGALGAWTATPSTYGFGSGSIPAAASGTVASQSFVSSASSLNYDWLARIAMQGDSTTPPTYNTMTTDMYMGPTSASATGTSWVGTNIWFPGGTNYAGTTTYTVPAGDTLSPGSINLGNATIIGSGGINHTAQINLTGSAPAYPTAYATNNVSLIELSTGCTGLNTNTGVYNPYSPVNCPAAIYVASGDIDVPSGGVIALNVAAGSDVRIKHDIHKIKDALDNIMKIDPVAFTYNSTGRKGMGVTAQNLEKVYPELVMDYNGTKYVEYNGLSGPLIGAVQELKRQNDDLRQQLKEQAARLDRLESKSSNP